MLPQSSSGIAGNFPIRTELPIPASPRYALLDAWRGVACLSVIVFHATFYSESSKDAVGFNQLASMLIRICGEMWVGVPIFFVISGYCISASADAARRRSEPPQRFFFKRFRRIYPPFWIFGGTMAVLVGLCESVAWPGLFADGNHPIKAPWTLSMWQWLGNVTLSETWRSNIVGEETALFLGHAWTLCYEEQFYIVCGLILLSAPRHFFEGAAVVTLAVIPLALLASRFHCRGFFFDGFWITFASGMVAYYHINYASARLRRKIECGFVIGMATCWCDPLQHWRFASIEQQGFVAFAFALTLVITHRWDRAIAQSRFVVPLQQCGLISYSLYLIHWPVTKAVSHVLALAGFESHWETLLVTIPACLTASLLVAWPFHLFVERRFLNVHLTAVADVGDVNRSEETPIHRAA